MSHFAEIKESNNEVVRVLVFSNEDVNAHGGDLSTEAEEWVKNTTPKSVDEPVYWKQTSYNKNFRKNYAGREFTYDSAGDVFITAKPFPSWTLNDDYEWIPPVEMILPQPHPSWIKGTNLSYEWDNTNAQYFWKAPLAFPSVLHYMDGSEEKKYDIRWDRNRDIWIGIKHDGSFWDFDSNSSTWSSSSITELPTKCVFYVTSWDENNQKWTAYDFWDNNINYEWNPSTQSWETI